MGVMQDAIEHRCGQRRIAAEGVVPLRKRQVGCQDHRTTPFISLGDDQVTHVQELLAF